MMCFDVSGWHMKERVKYKTAVVDQNRKSSVYIIWLIGEETLPQHICCLRELQAHQIGEVVTS